MNKIMSAFGGKKLLLIFPIIALLAAGCGASKQANNQTPVAQNTNPAPVNQAGGYLIIKELGVEFEKPTGMDDLQYINSGHITIQPGYFITQQLVDLNKSTGGKCSEYGIGYIGQYTAKQLDALKNDKNGQGVPDTVKVGDYFYSFSMPQEACSFNEQYKQLEVQQTNALSASILKTLRVTPASSATNIPADWKTYTNTKYGFEVSYPNDWDVVISEGAGNPIIAGFYFGPKGGDGTVNGPAGQGTVVDDSKWGVQIFNKNNVTNNQGRKFEQGDKVYVVFNEGLKPELFDKFMGSFKFTK